MTRQSKGARSYGVRDILNWKFEEQEFPDEWLKHFGNIPSRFLMYVDGDGGSGKTEYIMRTSQMLANHMGKVHLNNVEQGKHKQIKDSAIRNNFDETIPKGKFMYSSIKDFEKYNAKIERRNSGTIQIIDSISYFPLSVKQIQELIEKFKRKSFIFVGYKAHFAANRPIAHLCDIKVRVENFLAKPISRFGGNEILDIFPEKHEFGQYTPIPAAAVDTTDFENLDKEQPQLVETENGEPNAQQAD
jgi:nucleoside-triphosphatase THEP1